MNYQTPNLPVPVSEPVDLVYDPEQGLKKNLRFGLAVVGILILALFSLAAFVNVRGAVISGGHVSVESQVKQIAHPTGGVIAEIYVRDGQRVRAGDRLMRLDSQVSGVSASVSSESLDQMLAQKARLEAERDGRAAPVFPPELTRRQDAPARLAISEQLRLFRIRQEARLGTQSQLRERVRQLDEQISGFQAQIDANRRSVALTNQELEGLRQLWERRLVTLNRLNQLERAAVEYEGSIASLVASIAQARARITEIREQSLQIEQDARGQAGSELAELMTRLADQQVRRASTGDTYERTLITAPASGIVNELAYTTIGGVIPPAETIMKIVPDQDRLTVETRVSTIDIDQLRIGQEAVLLFSAFSAQTTPEINGVVEHVSAEAATDERTGAQFYRVRIGVPDHELRRLGGLTLVPGMPVEAHIQTNQRSLLSYILKPLRDQLNRAFREG